MSNKKPAYVNKRVLVFVVRTQTKSDNEEYLIMNQRTKQVSAITGHDCASKRLKQAALEKQVAEFLKAGGKIKVVSADPQINQKLVHGTRHAYVITQCRCGLCIKWANKNRVTKGVAA